MHARFGKDLECACRKLVDLLLVDHMKVTGGANGLEQGSL
jgi:hypothetical protein